MCQPSIALSLPDSSLGLRASEAEQQRFNLTFTSMWYWYGQANSLHYENLILNRTIKSYEKVTGISAQNETLMQDAFDIKNAVCRDCVPALEECEGNLVKFRGRAKRRGWTIVVSVPVALAVGFGIGSIVN